MPKAKLRIESERVDDLPIVLEFAKQMGIPEAIDQVLTKVHGNRTGLSYGHLAWGLIGAIATRHDHRLNHVEAWSVEHRHTLEVAMGTAVGAKEFTDDRLADLLWVLGDPEGQVGQAIEDRVGQRMVRAYRLPTDTGRADTTTVSVYHDREATEGLLAFGKSKDHRPDLRQFVEALGTLDPAGVPLVTSTLPGNHADDRVYWPLWQRMTRLLGHPDWLFVGDSKLHSAENLARIHRAQGWFLTPLPMKGTIPEEVAGWLQQRPRRLTPIRLPDEKGQLRVVGHGFEVERWVTWPDPDTGEVVTVPERVFLVCRTSFKQQQIQALMERLARAEAALKAKDGQRAKDPAAFEAEVQALVEQHRVADFLSVKVTWKVEREEKWLGRGRPGPKRPKQVMEYHRARVSVRRRGKAMETFKRQAGWRAYGTNAPKSRLTLQAAVEQYSGQWQPEHGFHRIKGGVLKVAPIFLRTDRHIRGLLLLVTMVLRLLTLIEFVARRNLTADGATLIGLYAGAPKKATARPTAERLLDAFEGITLYTVRIGHRVHRQLSPLTTLQKRILKYIGLSLSIYTALETG
jgi:transposase